MLGFVMAAASRIGFIVVLWKAVQDDGKVNWVEPASMTAVFALTLFSLRSTPDEPFGKIDQ